MIIFTPASKVLLAQWITQSVDTITHDLSADYLTSPKSMTVDINNNVHVVWQKREIDSNYNSWRIYYSYKSSTGKWSSPIPISDTLKKAITPSIVSSKFVNKIFLTYTQNFDGVMEIVLAINEGTKWNKIRITNGLTNSLNPTIDIDSKDYFHIVFSNDSLKRRIKYCTDQTGILEVSELVDNFSGNNDYAIPYITISFEDEISIIYNTIIVENQRVVFARKKVFQAIWTFEILPVSIDGVGILKFSVSGSLHYVFSSSKGLQFPNLSYYSYKEKSSTQWSKPELILNNFDGICTSLEIDKNEQIHVMLDSTADSFIIGKVYYATRYTKEWKSAIVNDFGKFIFSNFKLDNKGYGHVIASSQGFYEFENELVHFRSSNDLVSVKSIMSFHGQTFDLQQNFPNPFNSSTIVRYTIPFPSYINLVVYNSLGQIIKVLFSGLHEPGQFEIIFTGENLSTGVYFLFLISDNFKSNKSIILLK